MSNLLVNEAAVNKTENHMIGESGYYEAYTSDRGELFRSCQKEFGKCTGKVYMERKDEDDFACGWIFLKRKKYSDCQETYLHETWVTVYEQDD